MFICQNRMIYDLHRPVLYAFLGQPSYVNVSRKQTLLSHLKWMTGVYIMIKHSERCNYQYESFWDLKGFIKPVANSISSANFRFGFRRQHLTLQRYETIPFNGMNSCKPFMFWQHSPRLQTNALVTMLARLWAKITPPTESVTTIQ